MGRRQYRAFISYSHRDERWARWLHRALESYRIPRKLVGTATARGQIPRRLTPIFRDREELSSASDLSTKVKEALADSEAVVVICSPSAVASRWVNEEIREFRRLGRGDRMFALIVDGDPQARNGDACFPSALVSAENGESHEPLAADARKWADGRLLAKLKLLAGILDIPLDSLRRRDLQKRQKSWLLTSLAAVVAALLATLAITSRIADEKRRAFAQELIGFNLTDLGDRLPKLPDSELLGRLQEWGQAEQEALAREAGASAIEAAMALRQAGLEQSRKGDLEAALDEFRRSWAVLALQYRQQPEESEILFELGQAEFYLGQAFAQLGNFDDARLSFQLYADITRRLLRREPENSEWVLEMAYALTNLGQVEVMRESQDPEGALVYLRAALEFNQIARVLEPGNQRYWDEIEQSHANVADAHLALCDLGSAYTTRMDSVRLAREQYEAAPGDSLRKRLLASTLGGIANVQESIGLTDLALASLAESERLLRELADQEPDNVLVQRYLLTWRSRSVALLAETAETERAMGLSEDLRVDWERFFEATSTPDVRARVEFGQFLIARSRMALAAGLPDEAQQLIDEALLELLAVAQSAPDMASMREQMALAAYDYWEIHGALPPADVLGLLPATGPGPDRTTSCQDANIAAHLAVMRGDLSAAEGYTSYLLDKGYYEPGFIRFCRRQGLCAMPSAAE